MIIRTCDYNTTIRWEWSCPVFVKDGLFDREGTAVIGAKVHQPPSADDPYLYIEIPDRIFHALTRDWPAEVLAICHQLDWSLRWTHRGCYLHLEASELIEAIRGKHGDPAEEAADVLFVLMSVTENAGIAWTSVLEKLRQKIEKLHGRA